MFRGQNGDNRPVILDNLLHFLAQLTGGCTGALHLVNGKHEDIANELDICTLNIPAVGKPIQLECDSRYV